MKRPIGLWVAILLAACGPTKAPALNPANGLIVNKEEEQPMKEMIEVCDFLKKCGVYFIATVEGDQPRVRPFGTAAIFENRLYIQTGKKKKVSQQIRKNPKIEICALDLPAGKWLRIEAIAVEDDRREAKAFLLDQYPELKSRYSADDDNTQVLYLKNSTAVFSSFTGEPRVITF